MAFAPRRSWPRLMLRVRARPLEPVSMLRGAAVMRVLSARLATRGSVVVVFIMNMDMDVDMNYVMEVEEEDDEIETTVMLK